PERARKFFPTTRMRVEITGLQADFSGNLGKTTIIGSGFAGGVTSERATGVPRLVALDLAPQDRGHRSLGRCLRDRGVTAGAAAIERRVVVARCVDRKPLVLRVFEQPAAVPVGL